MGGIACVTGGRSAAVLTESSQFEGAALIPGRFTSSMAAITNPVPTPPSAAAAAAPDAAVMDRPTTSGLVTGLTFVGALVFAFAVRGGAVVGIALLFLVFVPLEKVFTLRPQKVFRKGLITDLTHLLVNNVLVAGAAIVLVVLAAIPFFWVRRFGIINALPGPVAIALAVVLVFLGVYWGHRLSHQVPFLWRFHSVHHSIEQMDWVASGRLHPFDSGFTQAFTVFPLFLLGYQGGVFAGVTVFVALLALFQHANVRLRFPVIRWIINTPEWHHWHHSIDPEARRQELRATGDRQDLRHRVPASRPSPHGVRHRFARACRRLLPPPRVPVHRGGPSERVGASASLGCPCAHPRRTGAHARERGRRTRVAARRPPGGPRVRPAQHDLVRRRRQRGSRSSRVASATATTTRSTARYATMPTV